MKWVPRCPGALLCLGVLVLAGCQATPRPAETEQLLAAPPPGWQLVYQLNTGDLRLAEFILPDEDDLSWTRKVTLESHASLRDIDPINALVTEGERMKEVCSFVSDFNVFSGLENAYPTSVRLFLCGEHKVLAQGEVELAKVIRGNRYLYIIRVTHRLPPFEQGQSGLDQGEIGFWSDYLSRITLCDTALSEHPCP